jgi:hypothetical protein
MGMNSLEENKAYADQAGAVGQVGQELYNWGSTFGSSKQIWQGYYDLKRDRKSFEKAIGLVGSIPFGMGTTPDMRDGLVNFVNDGSLPNLDFNNLKGSLQNGLDIMQKGVKILKDNKISVDPNINNLINLYNTSLQGLNQLSTSSSKMN